MGILLGYSATDQNVGYIDVNSGIDKTCHHAVFDEAWYLQQSRPPVAQLLYDLGLILEEDYDLPVAIVPTPIAAYPPTNAQPPRAEAIKNDLCATTTQPLLLRPTATSVTA